MKLRYCYAVVLSVVLIPCQLFADGTETLGPPSIALAGGSGIVTAGIGLHPPQTQPGTIDVDVPGTVVQVILYWSGAIAGTNGPSDDNIIVDGNAVTGTLIGGPAFFFSFSGKNFYYSSYRADVTALGLVSSGLNSLSVEGLDNIVGGLGENSGAGVLVVFDDGSTSDIGLVDGLDLAFAGFPEPRKSTIPQTFTFTPAAADRTAQLSIFAGSVGVDGRTSIVRTVSGGVTTDLNNVLASGDGPLWDSLTLSVPVPANASDLTIELISGDGVGPAASVSWTAAALDVPSEEPPPPGEGEGCTPGFWKQTHHLGSWPIESTTLFGAIFEDAFPGLSLFEVVNLKGGGLKRLGAHTVAAYLNSLSLGGYDLAPAEIVAAFNAVYPGSKTEYNSLKDDFVMLNESNCPFGSDSGGGAGLLEDDAAHEDVFFLRGDVNSNGYVDLSDSIVTLGWLFLGDTPPSCSDAADTNDDGDIDVADPILSLGFLFLGGRAPTYPGPFRCGSDVEQDDLGICRTELRCVR